MASYIVTLKPDATEDDLKTAINEAVRDGGKIEKKFTIFKGFSVRFDNNDAIRTFETKPYILAVERDGEVTTQ